MFAKANSDFEKRGGFSTWMESTTCTTSFVKLWGPVNTGCDLIIAASMTVSLLKHRQTTIQKSLHVRLTRMIQLTIQTGLATSATVISFTVLMNIVNSDSQPWPIVPGLVMGKMYSNSMMALLNNRVTIGGGRTICDPVEMVDMRLNTLQETFGDRIIRTSGSRIQSRTTHDRKGSSEIAVSV
ncbi:hypothetical protein AN958_01282 [Leucoagaricus sp. SymC.cos]|nr:hypothetical protein AN958_01282 [Leucoagaricus sp. SymC.cos]